MLVEKEKNILIIGSGMAGKILAKDLEKNHRELHLIGFVDDKIVASQKQLLGKIDDISNIVTIYKIDEIIIAIPSSDGALIRRSE